MASETGQICDLCFGVHTATSSCLDCKLNLCEDGVHQHAELAPNHQVVSLEDLNANPQWQNKKPSCTTHPDNCFKYFDNDCKQMVCMDCAILNHSGHKCSTLAEAAAECCKNSSSKIDQAQKRIQELKEAENSGAGVRHSLDQNYQHDVDLINAEFDKMLAALNARKHALLSSLSQHHKAKSDALDKHQGHLHLSRLVLDAMAQESKAAIASGDNVRILASAADLESITAAQAPVSLTPPTDDVLNTVVNSAKAIEAIDATGGVSNKATCAAKSTVGVWRAQPGGKGSFVVTARDDQGVQRDMGGDTVTVLLEQAVKIHVAGGTAQVEGVSVDDKGDGTYEVSFPLDQANEQKLSVLINGTPIHASPLALGFGPFEESEGLRLVVSEEGKVAENKTDKWGSAFGWKRVTEGKWRFRILKKPKWSWLMFGLLDASLDPAIVDYDSVGSYGIDMWNTYSSGEKETIDNLLEEDDEVLVELEADTLTVTNLTKDHVTKLSVPAAEYRLQLCLHQHTQVEWVE